MIGYVFHALREIRHLARCRICFVDRYDPVICLIDFESEHVELSSDDATRGVYGAFPLEPAVVQIWHAFGAFKRFGFQSYDTCEGHELTTMTRYRIHRNYSWVLCSGEGCRKAFAEAFNCPIERVVPLLRPEYDEFVKRRAAEAGEPYSFCFAPSGGVSTVSSETCTVLFAPTLRKSEESRHPFRDLHDADGWRVLEDEAVVEWAFHPLEQQGLAGGGVSDALLRAGIVVTDYSSIAYEAYLLRKPVVFFVPDIDEYRLSPGLNCDPLAACPQISFTDESDLIRFLLSALRDKASYPWDALENFAIMTIDEEDGSAVDRVVETALEWLDRKGRWYRGS